MAEPYIKEYVQKLPNPGAKWLIYKYREDVDPDYEYWAVLSNGTVQPYSRYDTGSDSDPKKPTSTGAAWSGGLGGGWLNAFTMVAPVAAGAGTIINSFAGNNRQRGVPLTENNAETVRAFRNYATNLGFAGLGAGVDALDAVESIDRARRGMNPGEDIEMALFNSLVSKYGGSGPGEQLAATDMARMLSTKAAQAFGLKLMRSKAGTKAATPGASPEQEFGGTADTASRGTAGGTFAGQAAGGAGIGADAGAVTKTRVPVPGEPGVMRDTGMTVGPQQLSDYLNNDWQGVFGAWMNSFRNAGAAGNFLQFLSRSANDYFLQYRGELAQNALDGKLPQGDFASFLTKGAIGNAGKIGGDPAFDATAKMRADQQRQSEIDAARAASNARTVAAAAPPAVPKPEDPSKGSFVDPYK